MYEANLACLRHPPEVVVKFVNRLIKEHEDSGGFERRRSSRTSTVVPAQIQPLDEDLYPCGDVLHVVTRNISGGGVAFLHSRPLAPPFLLIQFRSPRGAELQLIGQIRHCTPHGKLYEVGCRFVVQWPDEVHGSSAEH